MKLAQNVNKFTKNRSLPGTIISKTGTTCTVRISASGSLISNVTLNGGIGEVGDNITIVFKNGIPTAETTTKNISDIVPDTSTTRTKTTDPHAGQLEIEELPLRYDASAIMGIPLDDAAPSNGDVLTYDSATGVVKFAEGGTGGGSLYQSLKNVSGATIVAGDIVVWDTTEAQAVTTSAIIADNRVAGVVAAASIADDASGNIALIAGTIISVTCTTAGAVAVGDFLRQSGTLSQAESAGVFRDIAVFALALSSKAASTAGSVYCMLVPEFLYAITAYAAYATGGQPSGSTPVGTTEKFTYASATWASVTGGQLPSSAIRGLGPFTMNYGTSYGYFAGGSNTTVGSGDQSTSYKFTYSSETYATMSSSLPAVRGYGQGATADGSTKGYCVAGYLTAGWVTTCYKLVYSTDTWGASIGAVPAGTGERMTSCTDTTYVYALQSASSRITISADTLATQVGANLGANAQRWDSIFTFTSTAGYVSYNNTTPYAWKITYSSGNASTGNTNPSTIGGANSICDNSAYAWITSSIATPYDTTDKFTKSTETYSAATGSKPVVGRPSGGPLTVGAFG